MRTPITIRPEIPADFDQIYAVNFAAFGQDHESNLVVDLRENPDVFIPELSLVATKANEVVGHVLFTRIHIKDDKGNLNESLSLAPIAVKPELQKSGIGGQLIRKALAVAREMGFKSVFVLGHEDYYPKFGFSPARKWNIQPPYEVPSNAFMALELVTDGLKNVTGTAIFPKEFEGV